MSSTRFTAPWGKLLWVFTGIGVIVLVGSTVGLLMAMPLFGILEAICFGAILLVCFLCTCRGYRLEGKTLIIERIGWEKRVSLETLKAVRHHPDLMKGSIRVGNGGLFVFAGWFWSRTLGWFHLVGNDILGRPVLLELDGEKWMITPEDPNAFVKAAQALIAS